MVAITEVKNANEHLKASKETITAVFVGATAGIGLGSLQAFGKHVAKPKAIIVGRSRTNFAPHLKALQASNPDGEFEFIETDVSLLKNIDAVSKQIKDKAPSIDLLFQSQGYINFAGREENADGLDNCQSLRYYGRVRFVQQLLPNLSPDARVVSVLAGGKEGALIEDDLDLKRNYSVGNAANTSATLTTLTFEKLAKEHPGMGFVHYYPGLVKTGVLANSAKGILGVLMRWIITPILGLFATSAENSGEYGLFLATDGQYAKGARTVDWDGKVVDNESVLGEYRKNGMREKVWDHVVAMWEQAS